MSEQYIKIIDELKNMKKYPKKLFYKGDISLLKKRKVSIVGTRKPTLYSQQITHKISSELVKRGVVIVSGAAIGIDAISHTSAKSSNTIAVVANGLDIRYPAINSKLIKSIEENGLILSAYKDGEKARPYSFVLRNEIVTALGEILIVTQADENSGTLTSINYALKMNKKIYTIPHRLGESLGTQKLIQQGLIEPIYDLEKFLNSFGRILQQEDTLEVYLNTFPLYDEALKIYGNKIYELELEGKIIIKNGYINPV